MCLFLGLSHLLRWWMGSKTSLHPHPSLPGGLARQVCLEESDSPHDKLRVLVPLMTFYLVSKNVAPIILAPPVTPVLFTSLINRPRGLPHVYGALFNPLQFFAAPCLLIASATDVLIKHRSFCALRELICSVCACDATLSPALAPFPFLNSCFKP